MGIFERRVAFKPFEYPDIVKFKDAINHSYWLSNEWNFISDVHDFHGLSDKDKNVVKNALLAISQIEVSVKKFWSKLGETIPKPEFDQVGITFGECEVRHSDAYSNLLEILGLNTDFELLLQNPVIQGRVEYLTKYLKRSADNSNENFTLTLTLFSLFIEGVSLFAQFLIMKSFNKNCNIFKDIDNVIQATAKEEDLHMRFGAEIVKYIRAEYPEWFDENFYSKIYRAAKKAYESESEIIDWIFEKGELEFLSKEEVKEFTKNRFNEGIVMIGGEPVFQVDMKVIKNLKWFDEEILSPMNIDFFNKKSVSYSKKTQPITEEDLF